jgi:hypothetical protein
VGAFVNARIADLVAKLSAMKITSDDPVDVGGMGVMTHNPRVVIEMRGRSRLGNNILNTGAPSATHVRFLKLKYCYQTG